MITICNFSQLLWTIYLTITFPIVICNSINESLVTIEEKALNILNPLVVQKLWLRNSCLTYKTRIGTCLQRNECQSRNGTIGGLCLGLFSVCCLLDEIENQIKLPVNSRCVTNSNKQGICLKGNDCLQRHGISDGYCNTDLDVCCRVESICGKTITQNETVIVNKLYPLTTNDPNVCQIVIERQPNVCQLRIELLELSLAQPDSNGRCTTDALIIKTSVGEQIPIICGDNSGQHLYLESGRNLVKYGKPIRLSIVTNGINYHRKWKIRIIMIECDTHLMAPNGCLQYFTGISRVVRSFNFGKQIKGMARYMSDMSYTVCVRTEQNYCWIEWQPEYSDTFSWGTPLPINNSLINFNTMEDLCSRDDFITIDDGLSSDKTPELDRICGQRLSKHNYIFSNSKPFHLKVRSNSNHSINAEYSQNGFSLIFNQIPCNDFDE